MKTPRPTEPLPSPASAGLADEMAARMRSLALFPEQNPSPVLRIAASGCLLYANPAGKVLLASRSVEVGDTVPEDFHAIVVASLADGRAGELQIDSDARSFSFDVIPIPDQGYANLYGRDITGKKEAQQKKDDELVRWTAEQIAVETVNAMGEGVAVCDPGGNIRNVNPAFCSLTGYTQTDLLGKNILRLIPGIFEENGEDIQKALVRVRLKEWTQNPDDALTICSSKGINKYVIPTLTNMHGPQQALVGIVLTLRDISPLVEARDASRRSEQNYRQLVENANSIIMRISPDLRILFVNEYAQTLFGYPSDELLGNPALGSIIPETDSEGRRQVDIAEGIATQPETHGSCSLEHIGHDRTRVWVHWSNRAIRDKQGHVREILCVGTDITQLRRLEAQAKLYRSRLRALADRLAKTEEEERRRISTHIHDTVVQSLSLASIRLGGVLAALDKAGLTAQRDRVAGVRELLDEGTKECRGLMEQLVPSLLYEVGLHAAVKEFAEKQARTDGTSITVQDSDLPETLDDGFRGLLFQCAREFLMNALKHAGRCEIQVALTHNGQHLELQVEDTGQGFDPVEMEALQHDADGGFGLFNIRERIRGVGGQLEIQSAPGKGTVATVRVPLDPQ